MGKFTNDFEANGYGINRVQEKDLDFLNGATQIPDKCKCIIGPGTGLGQAIPSEGGHVDFAATDAEDFELQEFAKEYTRTSNNIENQRAKGSILTRVSVERLCAGPAIPLIYEFLK